MRRLQGNASRNKSSAPTRSSNPEARELEDAAQLQKRAERKRGLEALPVYEAACAAYRGIMANDKQTAQHKQTAAFELGDCLQKAADCLLTGVESTPESQLREAEANAATQASNMLQEAAAMYQQLSDVGGQMSIDALVNYGNAFSSLARLKQPQEALQLLEQAAQAYRKALSHAEDADTLSNLGDTLVAAADILTEAGKTDEARQTYSDAMQQYDKSCSLSNSDEGDDLPGLLNNWGVGLCSAGTHLKDANLVVEAVARLRSAKELGRSEIGIINVLGDTLLALAEILPRGEERTQALRQAQEEGFGAAMRIDRRNADALVGAAEAEMLLGRESEGETAQAHFQQSYRLYKAALEKPERLGSWKDRCEVRYNQACMAALGGDPQMAESLLQALIESGGASVNEIANDDDFRSLRA